MDVDQVNSLFQQPTTMIDTSGGQNDQSNPFAESPPVHMGMQQAAETAAGDPGHKAFFPAMVDQNDQN